MDSDSDDLELIADDTVASTSGTASNRGPLTGWTKSDKFCLYKGMRQYGSHRAQKIRLDYLRHKTCDEIEEAIAHYRASANKTLGRNIINTNIKKKIKPKPLIPLASWAKMLTDSMTYNELQTEIPTALRLMADLENMPSPILTEQIDFRMIYHHLADVMEGKTLPNHGIIADVINSCVLEAALVSKLFYKQFRSVLGNINMTNRDITGFPKPTKDTQLTIIRDLISQQNYNPLNITEESLCYPAGVNGEKKKPKQ